MFLKSLSLQGFKSFAERTTLEFTPGISVIVGPNGSGKSNLSDAIAWVLGEQGPKTLRGGKMEDVIFAGTPSRPASGRAEVSLTIDNSAGVLPIEFAEVTITRRIFRGGESEYELNGVPCRLLDVQELLSDSGIGRELHTIVGQGQLDQVLQARPEERRAYIEEAAGILKFRRRKERALRKLERTDSDIERLADVMGELRRQIRPLEQQAEMAKRAAEIQAELDAVKLRLWVHEYVATSTEGDREAEQRLAAEAASLATEVRTLGERVEALEAEGSKAFGAAEEALGAEYRLSSVRERLAALARLAEERARHLEDLSARAPEAVAPSPEMIAEAEAELAAVAVERAAAEADARRAEQEWVSLASSHEVAVRAHEEVVHMHGERAALRAALQAAEEERRRLQERRAFLSRRRDARRGDLDEVSDELRHLDDRETQLTTELERVQATHRERAVRAAAAAERLRALERTVESLQTRRSVIADETGRASSGGMLEGLPGLLGELRRLVRAKPGYERAVRAALEPVADAIVAAADEDAVRAVEHLRSSGGRARFLLPSPPRSIANESVAAVVDEAPDTVRAFLSGIALAGSLREAVEMVRSGAAAIAVTRDGDRVGESMISGGDPAAIGRDLQQELRGIDEELGSSSTALNEARREAERETASATAAERDVHALTERANGLDAELTGAAERLADLEREDHAAMREDAMMAGRISEVDERIASEQDRLASVEARLARAVADERPSIDSAALAAVERRASERSHQLGGLVERERAATRRVEELRVRARRIEEEILSWERSREARAMAARRAHGVGLAARNGGDRAAVWVEEIRRERFSREERRSRIATELADARRARREFEERAEQVRELAHRSDLARAERSHRLAALVERLRIEHQMSPDDALKAATAPEAEELEDVRRRAVTLERKLGLIGRVNPIAMEQFQGMVDRHAFLSEQVGDLKKSRRDLVAVVDEVDSRIEELFAAAFADVSREFEEVFARLFPGGEGRLTLVDRDDILSSGVEVEARPGGKRVKRISLLSGGERALTAIALLASIFRARPSPFYLLDEVEAALDDVNLHRFLSLAREFKIASQILIVTHQKRTMEVADILYGISMGSDGVTKVISQRLDEPSVATSV